MKRFTLPSTWSAIALAMAASCLLVPGPAPAQGVQIVAVNGTTVAVDESDSHIKLPAYLPAGSISFKVTNRGSKMHALEIKGAGFDQKLPALNPGAATIFTVDLKDGNYTVTDPEAPNLTATLTVES
ncbi:MAG TPA: hypothetical protein VGO93_21570 [Candidatus Xenobia bacterium]|jgi:hypothetical protein